MPMDTLRSKLLGEKAWREAQKQKKAYDEESKKSHMEPSVEPHMESSVKPLMKPSMEPHMESSVKPLMKPSMEPPGKESPVKTFIKKNLRDDVIIKNVKSAIKTLKSFSLRF